MITAVARSRHGACDYDGVASHITRWHDARHFFKRIVVRDGRSSGSLQHVERVAKVTLGDFVRMFTARMILLAQPVSAAGSAADGRRSPCATNSSGRG